MNITIKRVYDAPADDDGQRVLVDRLWPRGMTKEKARVDLWLREIAPSNELRVWFGHDPAKWPEFQAKFSTELDANVSAVNQLLSVLAKGPVTLIYGAKDSEHNNAVVIKSYIEKARPRA